MRLFQTGGFYLHDSPRLSAEWLNDRDTIAYTRNASVLLSTIIQYHIMERDTKLCVPDKSVLSDCDDVVAWAQSSVFSIAWLVDYYECLSHKAERVFKHTPLTWEYKRALKHYLSIGCFDICDVNPREWLPMSPSQARASYKHEVKRYTYRKVPMPYWFGPSPAGGKAEPYQPPVIPDYDLTDLDA